MPQASSDTSFPVPHRNSRTPESGDRTQRLKGRSFAETRSAVLDLIRVEGQITRADIARRSALTEKTISVIAQSLIEAGLVVEAGLAESSGGKRPILLRLNHEGLYAVGISVHVARCLIVICALDGTEVARSEIRGMGTEHPPAVVKRIAAALHRLLKRRAVDPESIIGVGVARGGREGAPTERDNDDAYIKAWEDYPTEAELSRLTGIAATRENDANCAALGEYWTSGSSVRDFATIYLAYRVSCGIVIDGSLYRGYSGNAGSVGHTIVDPAGAVCWCGRRGCLETVGSPHAITERVRNDAELRVACGVTPDMEFGEIYDRFAQAVRGGVAEAVELFERVAELLATAIINLVNALDLDLITLTGPGFTQLGEQFRAAIDEKVNAVGFLRDVHTTTIRLGAGGADAGALGAASLVLHRELTPHQGA
ncbi:ROK family transcriptional regulator [Microbacterium sp. GXF0217]